MNGTQDECVNLIKGIASEISRNQINNTEVVVFPPFISIESVLRNCNGTNIKVGAQNCASESQGAFTGEISALMLQSFLVSYVLIGHSERRIIFGENDALLFKKAEQALAAGLTPVLCVGEKLEERASGDYFNVVSKQLAETLFKFNETLVNKFVIAYEPVWAIGTGKTASPSEAQEMHKYIRQEIAKHAGNNIAENISLLYGGSCNAQNAKELFNCTDIDGGLIGGASLKINDFVTIVKTAEVG